MHAHKSQTFRTLNERQNSHRAEAQQAVRATAYLIQSENRMHHERWATSARMLTPIHDDVIILRQPREHVREAMEQSSSTIIAER